MKISELSQATQVPVPTIKFYIRERLVPAGQRTARNQADYGSAHVERLALIRALQDAGLRLETIARVIRAAETATEHFLIAAIDALERPVHAEVDPKSPVYAEAERMVLALIKRRSWKLHESDISVRDAIKALTLVRHAFPHDEDSRLDPYAEAAELLAVHEIPEGLEMSLASDAALRYALVGTVLLEPFILSLRRMAHVARTRKVVKSRPAPSKRSRRKA
jgi:DNA-binding transcriptional MerR regulator